MLFALAVLANCLLPVAFSQTVMVTPTFIGTTGGSGTVTPTMHISYSVGEAMVTTLGPSGGSVDKLTQGFQQPESVCPTAFTFSVTPSTSPVCAGTNVTIEVVPTGGTGPFTYEWSTGQTTTSSNIVVAPSITTAYTFSITGCPTTGMHTVTVSPPISASVSTTDISCFGSSNGSATISTSGGTSPLSYLWSNSATTTSITGLSAGPYSVIVTDAAGCTAAGRASFWLEDFTLANNTTTDAGPTAWTRTVTTVTAQVMFNQFEVAGANNGYMTWSSQSINISAFTGGVDLSVNLSESGTMDAGDIITTSYALNGGATVTFPINGSISNDFTSASAKATGLVGTTLQIFVNIQYDGASPSTEVYDFDNVQVSGSPFTISSPTSAVTASAGSNASICNGGGGSLTVSASGGTGPYVYSWQPGSQTTSAVTVSPTSTTVYTVTVTDANSCSAVATNTMNVSSPSVAAGGNNTICNGQSTTLNVSVATGGVLPYTYLWNPGNLSTTAITVSPTTTAAYTLTLTDAISCSSIAVYTVTVNPLPSAPTAFASPNPVCEGGSITLTATGGGGVYSWTGPSFSQTGSVASLSGVTTSAAGTYSVTETVNGCTSPVGIISVTVNASPSAPTASVSVTPVCEGQPINLTASNAGASYFWTGPGGYTSAVQNPVITPSTASHSGTYSVTATISGCTGPAGTVSVSVDAPPSLADAGTNQTICGSPASTNLAAVTPTSGTGTWVPLGPSGTVQTPSSPTSAVTGILAGDNVFQWTVSNGACTPSVATVTVTVNTAPVVSITETPASCASNCDGTATMTVSTGTAPFTYLWTDPGTQTVLTAISLCPGPYTCTVTDAAGCTASASIAVTAPLALSNVISTTSVTCNGNTDGTATATLTGGTIPYTYNWFNGQTTSTATGLGFGTHSVVVNDANGCSTPKNFNIVQPNPIILNTTAGGTSCASSCDGFAGVSATGGTGTFTYAWNSTPPQSTASATGLCAQNYSVLVTDANGCTATTSVTITPGPALSPTITATKTVVCAGSPVTLTASGGVTASYVWNPGNISGAVLTVNPTTQTTYTASVTLGSCTKDTTITININSTPAALISASSPLTICNGDIVTLTASPASGVSYSWSNGPSFNPVVVTPGVSSNSYTLVVTDATTTCSASATIAFTVNPLPIVGITGPTTLCSGNSTTLTASGGVSYAWVPASISNPLVVFLSVPTGYTVTATDVNGCSDTASIFVNVTPAPIASVTATPASICAGGTSTLTASGGTNYAWSPGGSTSATMITPVLTSNASYTVTVSNGACSDTQSVTINVTNFSVVISSTDPDSSICVGDNLTLTATPGASYFWNTGAITQSIPIIGVSTNTYVVTVTTSGGCSGTDMMVVTVNPTPVASITSSADTACLLSSVTLTAASGGASYQWTVGPSTAVYSPILLVQGNNTYTVTVSNGSCSSTATHVVFAKSLPTITANANPTGICAGDTVFLTATGGATYVWSTGALSASTVDTPLASTTYTVIGTAANSCSNFATTSVVLNTITVDAGADVTICPGFTAALNAATTGSTSGVSFSWSPAQFLNDPSVQDPSATPDTTAMFIVNVTNGSCSAKDSVMVSTIRTPACVIHVYNGITPNGDNDNNTWFIDGIQSYPINRVVIFNRWGNKVWSAKGYNNKDIVWKGTDQQGNILADATYYYFVELYDGDGGAVFPPQSGWVEVTH